MKSGILNFYVVFRCPEYFPDLPKPSGINFALVDVQNGGMASIFDHFQILGSWILENPEKATFETMDLVRPLKPNRHPENDPMLSISL